MLMGAYKKGIIKCGGRYALPFNGDGKLLFSDINVFYVRWEEQQIGKSVIFCPIPVQYASKVAILWQNNGAKIPIPEYYRRLLGLVKGSSVVIEFLDFDNKTGFRLSVI